MIPREVLPDPGGRVQAWLQRLSKGAVAKAIALAIGSVLCRLLGRRPRAR